MPCRFLFCNFISCFNFSVKKNLICTSHVIKKQEVKAGKPVDTEYRRRKLGNFQ